MGLTKPRAAQIYNLDYKQATRVVTTTNITLAGGAPSSVDGVSLSLNDRILVTGQSTASQNGLYYVTTVGSGANGTWVRTGDANQTGEIDAGMIIMVTEGAVYADTQWKLITDNPITVGSTALTFTQNYSANSISSGSSNVAVYANANVTISSAGTPNVLTVSSTGVVVGGNIVPTANATYTLGNATNVWKSLYVAGNSIYLGPLTLGATSSLLTVNGANVVTADASGNVSTTGNITGGNILTGGLISAAGNITGSYFLGNVACASGIYASRVFNGISEANIGTSGGNANISIGGVSNVVVFATTGEYVTGLLSVTGNITGGNVSATNYTGTNVSVTGTQTAASTVGGVMTGTSLSVTGTQTATSTVGGVITGSSVSVTANVTGSNILTTGIVSSTGNATHGNISSSGIISGAILNASTTTANTITTTLTSGADANFNLTAQNGVAQNLTNTEVARFGINHGPSNTGWDSFTQYIRGSASQNGYQTLWASNTQIATINSSGILVTGVTSATGNITGGNILTGGSISATGNITGGNVNTAGIVSTGGNVLGGGSTYVVVTNTQNATGVGTGAVQVSGGMSITKDLWVLGNVYGNLTGVTANIITIEDPLAYFYSASTYPYNYDIGFYSHFTGGAGNTYQHTGLVRDFNDNTWKLFSNVAEPVAGVVTFDGNTIYDAFKSGAITSTSSISAATTISATGNITGGNVSGGNVSATNHTGTNVSVTGTVTGASVVGGVMTGTSLSVGGNVTGANLVTTGLVTVTGNVYTGNILTNGYYYANGAVFGGGGGGGGTPGGANTYVQFNDNGVFNGTAGFVFNKTTNAVVTTGAISTTGTVTAASTVGGVITGSSTSVTGTVTGASLVGSITSSQVTTALGFTPYNSTNPSGYQTSSGTVATVSTAAQPNITSVGSSLTTSGTLTVNSVNNATAIINGGTNGGGNIGASGATFNTVFAKATTAQYADLAEMYSADAEYAPGTVVIFGGSDEITISTESHDTRVAGIISTDPAYLMNSFIEVNHPTEVALTGRVPCRVVGSIRKGDRLVSSGLYPGVATILDSQQYQPGCIIGKALENYQSTEVGVIEVAVGRF